MSKTLDEKIKEASYNQESPSHRNYYGCCQSDSDYEKSFVAGANFVKAEMQVEIDELKSKLELATEALEFYADKKSWYDVNIDSGLGSLHDGIIGYDCDGELYHGGKLARLVLTEIKNKRRSK